MSSEGRILKICVEAEATPIGGTFWGLGRYGELALNNRGEVAFTMVLHGAPSNFGLFLFSDGKLQKLLAAGEPGFAGGEWVMFEGLSLNDSSEVAFDGVIKGGSIEEGLFVLRHGGINRVVALGEDSPIGGQFSQLGAPMLNNAGQVAFRAAVDGGTSPEGIFLYSDGAIRKVAALGDPAPDGGTFLDFKGWAFNNLGHVAFWSRVEEDRRSGKKAIFLASGDSVRATVASTDPPLVGANWAIDWPVNLNDRDSVLFRAWGRAGRGEEAFAGLYLRAAGHTAAVAKVGEVIPSAGRIEGHVLWALNNVDSIAYLARTDVEGRRCHSILLHAEGLAQKVVTAGDRNLLGGVVRELWPYVGLNDRNEVLFVAAGDEPDFDEGIFLSTPT
jgi:hypothetical protein